MSNIVEQSVVNVLPEHPLLLCNWIGGEQVPPEGHAYLENINPATGRVISKNPKVTRVGRARGTAGGQRSAIDLEANVFSKRAALLDAIANRLEERKDEFAQAESLDTGKPFHIAKNVDISRAIANFRFFAGAIRHDETGCHMMGDAINYTIRKPLGVVALITPWEFTTVLVELEVGAGNRNGQFGCGQTV